MPLFVSCIFINIDAKCISLLLTDLQPKVVPGVYVLHRVFCQHRDLSDLRCADQEDPTSFCVPARFLQVSIFFFYRDRDTR